MMRKTSLILLGAAAGAAMTLVATQPRMVLLGASAKAAAADTYRQLNLFGDVFERVRADYVEKPDDSKLIETAINGMLAGLDPHSAYLDADAFKDMQSDIQGDFGSGITAMPSMHVALAWLFYLLVRERIKARLIRGGAFAFVLVTWFASVHLAWHYAVDGLVGILAVSAIWLAMRRLVYGPRPVRSTNRSKAFLPVS